VEALEAGELGPPLRDPQAAVGSPGPSPEALPTPMFATDPSAAIDVLHGLLATLSKGDTSGSVTSLEGTDGGPRLESRCGARIYGPTVRIKLDGLREQWGAEVVGKETDTIVYRIPLSQSFWRRCLGREKPSLEIAIRFQQPQALNSELTEVIVSARPVHCDAAQGSRLLNEVAPHVLESARSYLQATPERRGQERLVFKDALSVLPVFPGQAFGATVPCTGKDISPRGIGLVAGAELPSRQVLIGIRGRDCGEEFFMPAEVVRAHRRTDGRWEIGGRFAFGGFGAANR